MSVNIAMHSLPVSVNKLAEDGHWVKIWLDAGSVVKCVRHKTNDFYLEGSNQLPIQPDVEPYTFWQVRYFQYMCKCLPQGLIFKAVVKIP